MQTIEVKLGGLGQWTDDFTPAQVMSMIELGIPASRIDDETPKGLKRCFSQSAWPTAIKPAHFFSSSFENNNYDSTLFFLI